MEQAPARAASPGRIGDGADGIERLRHERSLSSPTVPVGGLTPPNQPGKTFESNGAPVVKKKGRFVVTSVSVQAPTSQPMPPEQNVVQQQLPVHLRTDLARQSYEGPSSVMAMAPPGQLFYAANPSHDGTGTIVAPAMVQQPVQSAPPPAPVEPPLPPPTSNRLSPVPMMAASVPSEANSPSTSLQQPQLASSEESGPSNFSSAATETRAPTSRPTASRNSAPGLAGQQGFGKMLYFLDQMRLEVTDADMKIKSLQTDMKCLVSDDNQGKTTVKDSEHQ